MKRMLVVAAIAIPAVVIVGLYAHVISRAPRMKEQEHIRAYQTVAPLPPRGTVPVDAPAHTPYAVSPASMKNPLPPTPENIGRGKIYYSYYCLFCHGERGGGNGPVGESFVPVPADLRTEKIQRYGDGQLMKGMLTGVGHEPVLEQVVSPRHRWHLVLFVRSLGGTP